MVWEMAVSDRWNLVSPDHLDDEVERLLSLSALDRKLELICRPLGVIVGGLFWQYINAIHEPAGYGGSLSATSTNNGIINGLIQVVSIHHNWIWSVYPDGVKLSASGQASNIIAAMKDSASYLRSIMGTSLKNEYEDNGSDLDRHSSVEAAARHYYKSVSPSGENLGTG